jgi:formylglycine-generating enzyme required for sulfatase activity
MTNLKQAFTIPGYRLIRRLGVGGMATVYLAHQESLSRLVAIKVLASDHAPSEELVRRFENEARTIARLDHPHIMQIFDVGRTSSGQIYYTMPHLPNGDLSERNLRDDPERVLAVMRALAEALGCAHDHGIVHRDVKPENVLFDKLDRPMLADFGIALTGSNQPRMTREGATIGSSGYMSPEQARGQPIDGRSDLYSLGVVGYELLTGEMPFQGADALAIALAHIEKPVPRMPVTRRLWQPLIDKALAKHPDSRFQSAEEMLAAIDIIARRMRGPSRSGVARGWHALVERTVAIPRRQRALVIVGLLALVLAALMALSPHVPERTTPAIEDTPTAATASDTPPVVAAETTPTAIAVVDEHATARDRHLQQAATLMSANHLLTPAGGNAADEYLALLGEEPHQADAVKGIATILDRLATNAAVAIAADNTRAAGEAITQALALGERAGEDADPARKAFARAVHVAVEQHRSQRRDASDLAPLLALKPLLPALARVDSKQAKEIETAIEQSKQPAGAISNLQDDGGPQMVVLPAGRDGAPPIAMSADEVTRGAYAAFASATGRATAQCRSSQLLVARVGLRSIDWRKPGFEQSDDHPVVCVSWNDAVAYARWMSTRTGSHYRLPNSSEWLLAARTAGTGTGCGAANIETHANACNDGFEHTAPVGRFGANAGLHDMAGNVSEWVDVCAKRGRVGDTCPVHRFRGLSWRDDDDESNLDRMDTADADVGYANVGFRLMRELADPGGAH